MCPQWVWGQCQATNCGFLGGSAFAISNEKVIMRVLNHCLVYARQIRINMLPTPKPLFFWVELLQLYKLVPPPLPASNQLAHLVFIRNTAPVCTECCHIDVKTTAAQIKQAQTEVKCIRHVCLIQRNAINVNTLFSSLVHTEKSLFNNPWNSQTQRWVSAILEGHSGSTNLHQGQSSTRLWYANLQVHGQYYSLFS